MHTYENNTALWIKVVAFSITENVFQLPAQLVECQT